MRVVAKSDLSTGNSVFASYVLQSNDLVRFAACTRHVAVCDASLEQPGAGVVIEGEVQPPLDARPLVASLGSHCLTSCVQAVCCRVRLCAA